jgi:hypothetical protein
MDEIKPIKPLGYKAYGSIPHLPGSRLGSGDHHCEEGQAKIATEKARDHHDIIIVQEKLDGSNCSVAKINGEIIPLGRAGYRATDSPFLVHLIFHRWVQENMERFTSLLNEGERVCGEFLAVAHGTKYNLVHEPFVAFDLMTGSKRVPYSLFESRVKKHDFVIPRLIHMGTPFSIDLALAAIVQSSGHGAIDPVEGAIWRVERKGEVDFLTKFVQHDKEDGKYLEENNNGYSIFNLDVTHYLDEAKWNA